MIQIHSSVRSRAEAELASDAQQGEAVGTLWIVQHTVIVRGQNSNTQIS